MPSIGCALNIQAAYEYGSFLAVGDKEVDSSLNFQIADIVFSTIIINEKKSTKGKTKQQLCILIVTGVYPDLLGERENR